MKVTTDEDGAIEIREVYSGIGLKTNSGERMGICMRDSGFEFTYENKHYSAQQGVITEIPVSMYDTSIEHERKIRGLQLDDESIDIEQIAKNGSLIPAIYDDKGKVVEVIFCESMSGGQDQKNHMPRTLTLTKLTSDNKKMDAKYVQV